MVSQRRSLLDYLKKTDIERYHEVVNRLASAGSFAQHSPREIFESLFSKAASIEELVAVPNVTAIDWKQADVYGPGFEHQGGMSFTVQEARAAFVFSQFYLPASRWRAPGNIADFCPTAGG